MKIKELNRSLYAAVYNYSYICTTHSLGEMTYNANRPGCSIIQVLRDSREDI